MGGVVHARQPLGGGWVRVVELHVHRVGCERGGIIFVELEQGGGQVGAAGLGDGVGVCLEFVAARKLREQRRDEKREDWHHKHEKQQGQCVIGGCGQGGVQRDTRPHAQAGVEPHLVGEPAQQCKACQAQC